MGQFGQLCTALKVPQTPGITLCSPDFVSCALTDVQLRCALLRLDFHSITKSGRGQASRTVNAARSWRSSEAASRRTAIHHVSIAAIAHSPSQKGADRQGNKLSSGGAIVLDKESNAIGVARQWKTLSEAVEGGAVKQLGELQALDENLCVPNSTSWEKVSG